MGFKLHEIIVSRGDPSTNYDEMNRFFLIQLHAKQNRRGNGH